MGNGNVNKMIIHDTYIIHRYLVPFVALPAACPFMFILRILLYFHSLLFYIVFAGWTRTYLHTWVLIIFKLWWYLCAGWVEGVLWNALLWMNWHKPSVFPVPRHNFCYPRHQHNPHFLLWLAGVCLLKGCGHWAILNAKANTKVLFVYDQQQTHSLIISLQTSTYILTKLTK